MLKKRLTAVKSEILSYTRSERLFILVAMFCGFCITSDYSIVKPTCNSIFISAHSVKLFPYAWLAIVPLNFLIVSLYNRFLPKLGCFRLFLCSAVLIISGNLFTAFFADSIPYLPFLHYIWKDVYVLLMFQQLWSVIHTTIPVSRAKYLYGILYGVGGLGSVLGSLVPSFFATKVGSQKLLLMTLPIYFLFIFLYRILIQKSRGDISELEQGLPTQGFKLIANSRHLKLILSIVILMQMSTTIIEFQFNTFLEKMIPMRDLRTAYAGRVLGAIHTLNVFFQFFGSFLLVHLLGLRRSHFALPFVLTLNAVGSLLMPTFKMISFSFATIKSFDYSLFGIIKEMLYIPLKTEEKFHAKSIIDVFAYRSAKACASLILLALNFYIPAKLPFALSWCPLIFFLTWMTLIALLYRPKQLQTT